jgi:hypothetical protein
MSRAPYTHMLSRSTSVRRFGQEASTPFLFVVPQPYAPAASGLFPYVRQTSRRAPGLLDGQMAFLYGASSAAADTDRTSHTVLLAPCRSRPFSPPSSRGSYWGGRRGGLVTRPVSSATCVTLVVFRASTEVPGGTYSLLGGFTSYSLAFREEAFSECGLPVYGSRKRRVDLLDRGYGRSAG